MNIDIVNTHIAKQLGIPPADVAQVNKFYWGKIKEHFYSYNPRPINVDHICTFAINKYRIKDKIIHYIRILRKLRKSGQNGPKAQDYTKALYKHIRGLWAARKHHKYTN